MTLEIQFAGTPEYRAPFPNDGLYKIKCFEMSDATTISIYRSGDEFFYRDSLSERDELIGINYNGDPDENMEILKTCFPMRQSDKISFVRTYDRYQSQADPNIEITRDLWAVTLMTTETYMTERGEIEVGNFCESIKTYFGHSFILVEKINHIGLVNLQRIHITNREYPYLDDEGNASEKSFVVAYVHDVTYNEKWKKADTYLRPAHLVEEMIDQVRHSNLECMEALHSGLESPIPYNSICPDPENGIQNCLSWSLKMLEIVKVPHPITEYWAPGKNYYVPNWHVRPMLKLCERITDDAARVKRTLKDESLKKIERYQLSIKEEKEKLKISIAAILPVTLFLACTGIGAILIPISLIGIPIACVRRGYNINRMEKHLKKNTALMLKQTINGDL